MILFDTLETPEGVVLYFPFGTWGAGHLVDERTQAALATWKSWYRWVPLFYVLAAPTRYILGITILEAFGAAWLLLVLVGQIAERYILRNSPKSSVRVSKDERLRVMVADGFWAHLFRLNAGFLAFFLAVAVFVSTTAVGLDRWLIVPVVAADIALLVDLVRIWRAKPPSAKATAPT